MDEINWSPYVGALPVAKMSPLLKPTVCFCTLTVKGSRCQLWAYCGEGKDTEHGGESYSPICTCPIVGGSVGHGELFGKGSEENGEGSKVEECGGRRDWGAGAL